MPGEMFSLTEIFPKSKREETQSFVATSSDLYREIRSKWGLCKLYQDTGFVVFNYFAKKSIMAHRN